MLLMRAPTGMSCRGAKEDRTSFACISMERMHSSLVVLNVRRRNERAREHHLKAPSEHRQKGRQGCLGLSSAKRKGSQ